MDHLLENFATGRFAIDIDLPDHEGNTCLHAAVRKWVILIVNIKIFSYAITLLLIRCLEQESARSIIEKLVRIWKIILTVRKERESGYFMQVERGAQLSKKNNNQKTPLDLMFECIQSPGDFISSLWNKRVSLRKDNQNNFRTQELSVILTN